jgi:hypothetical protein
MGKAGAWMFAIGVTDTLALMRAQEGYLVAGVFILQIVLLYRVWRHGGRIAWAVLFVLAGIAIALIVEVVTADRVAAGAIGFVVTQSLAVVMTLVGLMAPPVRARLQAVRLLQPKPKSLASNGKWM